MLAFAGLDGAAFLTETDTTTMLVNSVVANEVLELKAKERADLATLIINKLGEALK